MSTANISTGTTKSALLLLLGVTMSCAIGELMMRIGTADQKNYVIEMWRHVNLLKQRSTNPAIGYEHQPNTKAMLQGVEISVNELGMRDPPLMPAESVRKRIIILGDSSALGWGGRESAIRGWKFVDLQPLFSGPPTDSYWVSADDIHLNTEATHLIAERLLPLLRM